MQTLDHDAVEAALLVRLVLGCDRADSRTSFGYTVR